MNLKANLLAGAVAAVLSSAAAQAGEIFLNIGTDYVPGGADKECPTCTAAVDEFTYSYSSETIVTDVNSSGTIDAGDTTVTTAGLALPGATFAGNQITSLLPGQTLFPAANSNNGLGNNWQVGFSIENLLGTVLSVGAVPNLVYHPGSTLKMFAVDSTLGGGTPINFMNVALSGGQATGVSSFFRGVVDFTGIETDPTLNPFRNLFNVVTPTCGGLTGFGDIWDDCGAGDLDELEIVFDSSFETNVSTIVITPLDDGRISLSADHVGRASFNIPEPSVLAMLGGGLLAFGALRRRSTKGLSKSS